MLSFLASLVATVGILAAGALGYEQRTAERMESPLREWKDRQALCEAPHNPRTASLCALLEHGRAP